MPSEYSTGCSDCGYRTSSVKSAGKHMGDLAPYCDLKMQFITAKKQLEKDEACIESLECADWPCPVCGETCDLMINKHKQPYFACKVHGELADPDHLVTQSVSRKETVTK